jgi:hypothetical protein
MPVTFFVSDGNRLTMLKDTGIEHQSGWWNSLAAADFDNDGDIDYVAGNLGWNNAFQVSADHPVVCMAKDFDANGSIDPVIACYVRESVDSKVRKLYPVHFWDELNSQSPKFRKKFARYKQFSKVVLDDLFTDEESKDAIMLKANNMSTSYIENIGAGKFKMSDLPVETQVAPVNGIVTGDFNDDGNIDVIMTGNNYGNEVFIGRYDAFIGLLLEGKGDGSFRVVPALESGFVVDGDAKALARLSAPGEEIYIATQNKGPLRAFTVAGSTGTYYRPESGDRWAEIELPSGKKQRMEFYKGSGYLSQPGSAVHFPSNATVTIHRAKNETKRIVSGLK